MPDIAGEGAALLAVKDYLAGVEASRIEIRQRVGTPMWKRQGWEPSFRRGHKHSDPLDEARDLSRQESLNGVVMLPASLLKALVERRECSARRDFTSDEDGPTSWVTHAVCRVAEGHEGSHSNGYYSWTDEQRGRSPEAGERRG